MLLTRRLRDMECAVKTERLELHCGLLLRSVHVTQTIAALYTMPASWCMEEDIPT
jgi:hypothetical protein